MKKLLTLLLLLATSFAFAQDGYKLSEGEYESFKAKVNNLSEPEAIALAERLAKASPDDYVFLKSKKAKTGMGVILSRTDLTPEEQKKQEDNGCVRCFQVLFRNGDTGYNLFQIFGTYDELFPIWKTEFLTSADYHEAMDNFRQRDIKSTKTGTDIRLMQNGNMWTIINNSR